MTTTARSFDLATKTNHGAPMASDERTNYRAERLAGDDLKGDFLARRAAEKIQRLPTLAVGQKWRNVAAFRARTGRKMLANR